MLPLALATAPGCGGASTAVLAPGPRGDVALNSALVLELDGPVDPLSVTPTSVSAWRDDGRPLVSRVETSAGRIVLQLEVDAALLADPPGAVRVRLLGLPSPHAVGSLDERRLAATTEVRFPVARGLEPRGSSPARLLELDGRPPQPGLELAPGGPLVLLLDGVLDPGTLSPADCPLFPLEQGLVLSSPALPQVRWRCLGERFELTLDLSGQRGRFQLDLRRFRWRDLRGEIPEPALVAEVLAP